MEYNPVSKIYFMKEAPGRILHSSPRDILWVTPIPYVVTVEDAGMLAEDLAKDALFRIRPVLGSLHYADLTRSQLRDLAETLLCIADEYDGAANS